MGVQVVTIAMTTGARAEQVGRLVAERLGFQYINDEIIDRAAEHAGVSRQEMAQVEHSPSLISRIITAIGSTPFNESGAGLLAAEEIDASLSYRRVQSPDAADRIDRVHPTTQRSLRARSSKLSSSGYPPRFQSVIFVVSAFRRTVFAGHSDQM